MNAAPDVALTILHYGTQGDAYGRASAQMQHALVHGIVREVTVEPWADGWRVITFDAPAEVTV